MARAESREPKPSPEDLERLRRFMEEDTGDDFVMVNVIDIYETPLSIEGVEPGQSSEETVAGRPSPVINSSVQQVVAKITARQRFLSARRRLLRKTKGILPDQYVGSLPSTSRSLHDELAGAVSENTYQNVQDATNIAISGEDGSPFQEVRRGRQTR